MKIAFVHTDLRIYWPARLKALNDALNKKGDSLSVIEIAGKGSPYVFASTARQDDLDWRILFPESSPEELPSSKVKKSLHKELDKINPDVVIAGAIAFASGANSVSWAVKNRKKVIIFDDTKAEINQRSGLVNRIKQAVYSGVDAMLYPAPQWVPTGVRWGFKPEQLFYGIDVVDNDFWKEKGKTDSEVPEENSFFLTVGRSLPIKNFETILEAYAKYLNNCNDKPKRLVLIGNGPQRNNLEQLSKDLSVSEFVDFLDFKSQTELRNYYQNCTAFILPSHEETWGLVINEAQAAGAITAASKQCGATDSLIVDDVNGFSFNHDDTERLAEILTIISRLDSETRSQYKTNALKQIDLYGLNKFTEGCRSAIEYVLKNKYKTLSLVDKSIIKLWKGRYRPK